MVGKRLDIGYGKWAADFQKYFPPLVSIKGAAIIQNVDLSGFPEAEIDILRSKKDGELEKLRDSNARRLKDKDSGLPGLSKDRKKKDKSYSRAKAAQMGVA